MCGCDRNPVFQGVKNKIKCTEMEINEVCPRTANDSGVLRELNVVYVFK